MPQIQKVNKKIQNKTLAINLPPRSKDTTHMLCTRHYLKKYKIRCIKYCILSGRQRCLQPWRARRSALLFLVSWMLSEKSIGPRRLRQDLHGIDWARPVKARLLNGPCRACPWAEVPAQAQHGCTQAVPCRPVGPFRHGRPAAPPRREQRRLAPPGGAGRSRRRAGKTDRTAARGR
jgi:hypothetical protein